MPRQAEVDEWFKTYENPLKSVMQQVRTTLLSDPRIDECIKWSCPTFTFNGNMASFNPRSKKHVSIMFHTGAKIRGKHPLLWGNGETTRFVNITDEADLRDKTPELLAIVKAWCELKLSTKKKAATKKKKSGA